MLCLFFFLFVATKSCLTYLLHRWLFKYVFILILLLKSLKPLTCNLYLLIRLAEAVTDNWCCSTWSFYVFLWRFSCFYSRFCWFKLWSFILNSLLWLFLLVFDLLAFGVTYKLLFDHSRFVCFCQFNIPMNGQFANFVRTIGKTVNFFFGSKTWRDNLVRFLFQILNLLFKEY